MNHPTRWRFFVILSCIFVLSGAAQSHAVESQEYHLTVDGLDRTYLLYRPRSLTQTPAPLVIFLHGGFGSGEQGEKSYGWDEAADKKGFVVAYPDGLKRAWNAGGICCGQPAKESIDDLAFLTHLISSISQKISIDPKRVYLSGMSNGAAMAYRYACEGSYPIAAIGSVSGSLAFACKPQRAVSIMEIHGKEDENIPFNGGVGTKGVTQVPWLGVPQTLNLFRQAAGCQPAASRQEGTLEITTSLCAGNHEVTVIGVAGAGHQWPGAQSMRRLGLMFQPDPPSTALSATATLWSFFESHPAP